MRLGEFVNNARLGGPKEADREEGEEREEKEERAEMQMRMSMSVREEIGRMLRFNVEGSSNSQRR